MLFVTLSAVVAGLVGRGIVLGQRAEFHNNEFLRLIDEAVTIYEHERASNPSARVTKNWEGWDPEKVAKIQLLIEQSQRHKAAEKACLRAIWRPWNINPERTLREPSSLPRVAD